MKSIGQFWVLLVTVLFYLPWSWAVHAQQSLRPTPTASSSLEFIPNRGQLADQYGKQMPEVRYTLNGHGVKFYFTENSMHYVFSRCISTKRLTHERFQRTQECNTSNQPERDSVMLCRVDVHFEGAKSGVRILAEDTAADYTNYYLTQCPQGITHVPAFHKIVYRSLYPHIDLVLHTSDSKQGMEYDFVVHPGGDPSMIKMRFDHANSLAILPDGSFFLSSPLGTMSDEKPKAYQSNLESQRVRSQFQLNGRTLRFAIGPYDRTRDLTIDPPRLWATYYGGNDMEQVMEVKNGVSSRIVLAGYTGSGGLASTGAYQTTVSGGDDAFVAAFDGGGSRIWATYYGGLGYDEPIGLATDTAGNVILALATTSSGLATAGAYQTVNHGGPTYGYDNMVTKFDSTGARLWSTYFGGPDEEDHSDLYDRLACDKGGNIYLGSFTASATEIATAGSYQSSFLGSPRSVEGYIARFSPAGSLAWATYYGSDNRINSIAIDTDGNVIVGGDEVADPYLASPGAYQTSEGGSGDGFLAKLTSSGSRLWGTYYGGSGTEDISDVSVDSLNNIVVVGSTLGTSGIASAGAFQTSYAGNCDGFVAKFTSSGNRLWGTYYGGPGHDELFAVACQGSNIYVSGYTSSASGIATAGSYQSSLNGTSDLALAAFDSSGRLRWGSYYGGKGDEGDGNCAVDRWGHLVLAGVTNSSSGISTPGSFQPALNDSYDGFLVKFCDVPKPGVTALPHDTICLGDSLALRARGNYVGYQWYVGDSAIASGTQSTFSPSDSLAPGLYKYTVAGTIPGGCTALSDTVFAVVRQNPIVSAGNDTAVCHGSSLVLSAHVTGGTAPYTYRWSPGTGLSNTSILQPTASLSDSATYRLDVSDANGCSSHATVHVRVNPLPVFPAFSNKVICAGDSTTIGSPVTIGKAPVSYFWYPSSGLNNFTSPTPTASPVTTTAYTVTALDANGCLTQDTVTVVVVPLPLPTIKADHSRLYCMSDSATLSTDGFYASYRWSTGNTTPTITVGPGTYTVQVTNATGCTSVISNGITIGKTDLVRAIVGPQSDCMGDTAFYSTTVDAAVAYEWSVSPGGILVSGQGTSNIRVGWNTDGSHKLGLHASAEGGRCSFDTVLVVTISDTLSPAVIPDSAATLCPGGNLLLVAESGYATYQWSTGETTSSIFVTKPGSYWVKVTNATGCTGTSNLVHVRAATDSLPKPELDWPATFCAGDTIEVGTTKPYSSYLWSTGETTPTIRIFKGGKYSVTVINAEGCSGTSLADSIAPTAKPGTAIIIDGIDTICQGDAQRLWAGPADYYRWWLNGAELPDTTKSILGTSDGIYKCVAYTNAGCVDSGQAYLHVIPRPRAVISGPASLCIGAAATYRVPVQSGTSVSWQLQPASIGTVQTTAADSIDIQWNAQAKGFLIATVKGTYGCASADTIAITVDTHLNPTITANSALAFCAGDSVTLDAGSGYNTYQWSQDGSTITGATKEWLKVNRSGQYSVLVTNSGGCSGSSQSTQVTVYSAPSKPVITASGTQLTSTPATHYQWSRDGVVLRNDTTATIRADTIGNYIVTTQDSNGCFATSDPYAFTIQGFVRVLLTTITRVAPTEQFSLNVSLSNASNLFESGARSYLGLLRLHSSLGQPINPAGTMSGNDWLIPIGGPWTPGQTDLQTITLKAGTLDPDCDIITFDSFYFPKAFVAVTTDTATICIDGACHPFISTADTVLAIHRIVPNPSNGMFSIRYHIAESGPAELYLEDILGRSAYTCFEGPKVAGTFEEFYKVGEVPSGLYRLVLKSGTAIRTVMIEIDN